MSGRKKRLELIEQIQDIRKSKVIVYFTGHGKVSQSMIAEDAVLPIYQHLLSSTSDEEDTPNIDLFLFTHGGDVSVPWRIVTMIREFCGRFAVLIPYKAYSAGTMISLGADEVVMGRKAELSPIDPTLVRRTVSEAEIPPRQISVEDVSSYISFMRDRAGITDQAALAQVVSQLAAHLTPLTLGTVNRQYSHIRLVARKLISSRNDRLEEERISSIVEALTEKMYSHGHAIGRSEAKDLGLPIDIPDSELEQAIWSLYLEYEKELERGLSIDPEEILESEDKDEARLTDVPVAAIESAKNLHVYEINAFMRRKRQVPPSPQININLPIGLPPGIDPNKIPKNLQNIIQELLKQIGNEIPRLVQEELKRQSPIIGIEGRTYGGQWKEKTK